MSNTIESKPEASCSGALIKRKALRQRRTRENLLAEAKRRAKQLCKIAEEQAESIRREAFRAGYAEGLHSSITTMIEGGQRMAEHLEQDLQARVRAILQRLFVADELLLPLIDELVQQELTPEVRRLRIHWPAFANRARHEVSRRLSEAGLQAQVVDAADPHRLVLEWGEHLWEFDTADALNRTTAAVMLSLQKTLALEDAKGEVKHHVLAGLQREFGINGRSRGCSEPGGNSTSQEKCI